jgi:hypothetical protein
MNKYEQWQHDRTPSSLVGRVFREKTSGSAWRITNDSHSTIYAVCLWSSIPWQIGDTGRITREELATHCVEVIEGVRA